MQEFREFAEEFKKNLLTRKPSKKIILWQEERLLEKYFMQLNRCVNLQQDPAYHQDDVFTHSIKTCDNVPPDKILRWAALLHDLGKYETRDHHIICGRLLPEKHIISFCKSKNRKCYAKCEDAVKRITFYRHEIASERIAKKVLKRYKVPFPIGQKITDLVLGHMYHFTSQWSDKALERFINSNGLTKADLENWEDFPLFRLRLADRISRGLQPVTQKQLDFIARLKDYFLNKQEN